MSFILVDRITQFESGKKVEGLKHILASDQYLTRSQSSDHNVYISSLVGEAVGQLAAWSVMHALDFTKRPVAGIVSKVNIFDEVKVGETLLLSAEIDELDDKAVEYHGCAYVGTRKIFEIESAIGPMVAMDDMISQSDVKAQFDNIFNLEQSNQVDFKSHLAASSSIINNPLIEFDNYQTMQKDQLCTAEKFINVNAPYFADHFPLKPVLPLTILLGCKIQMAYHYLNEFYPSEKFKVNNVRKIKMSKFVEPGSTLQTQMKAKLKDSQLCFQFKSYAGEQRVCLCEVVFDRKP